MLIIILFRRSLIARFSVDIQIRLPWFPTWEVIRE